MCYLDRCTTPVWDSSAQENKVVRKSLWSQAGDEHDEEWHLLHMHASLERSTRFAFRGQIAENRFCTSSSTRCHNTAQHGTQHFDLDLILGTKTDRTVLSLPEWFMPRTRLGKISQSSPVASSQNLACRMACCVAPVMADPPGPLHP